MDKIWSALCYIGGKLVLAMQCLLVAGLITWFLESIIITDTKHNLFWTLLITTWITAWSLVQINEKFEKLKKKIEIFGKVDNPELFLERIAKAKTYGDLEDIRGNDKRQDYAVIVTHDNG